MTTARVCLLIVLGIAICNAADLQVGTTINGTLAYSETVRLAAIPFTTRNKNVFYNSNNSSRIIKGISAIDIDKSNGRATITSGGPGFMYTNIRIRGSRGDALNYLVQIFV